MHIAYDMQIYQCISLCAQGSGENWDGVKAKLVITGNLTKRKPTCTLEPNLLRFKSFNFLLIQWPWVIT